MSELSEGQPPRPEDDASHAEWVAYAVVRLEMTPAEADGFSRAELIALVNDADSQEG